MVPKNGQDSAGGNVEQDEDNVEEATGGGGGGQQSDANQAAVLQQGTQCAPTGVQGMEVNYGDLQAMLMQYVGPTIKIESPSEYSSAHASSLDSGNDGPWRMFVPDFNSLLDDMEEEDNILMDQALWPAAEMLTNEQARYVDVDPANKELAIVNWLPNGPLTVFSGGHKPDPELVGPTIPTFEGHGSGLLNMIVDQALGHMVNDDNLEARPTHVLQGVPVTDTRLPSTLKRMRSVGINSQSQPKAFEELGFGDVSSVISQLETVVEKVERAVRELPSSAKNKKIKKTISMAAVEVRDFTRLLEENTKVEGMLLNDDKAVVIVSSDSSESSEGRGKKRKSRSVSNWERSTAVSSRIRGKTAQKLARAAELVKNSLRRKTGRMPVRKVKARSFKISTALTLAPPMPGTDVK